jgi:hypothetical protein
MRSALWVKRELDPIRQVLGAAVLSEDVRSISCSRPLPQRDASPRRVGWPPRVFIEQRAYWPIGLAQSLSCRETCRWGDSIPEPDGTGLLTLDLEAVAPPPNLPIRVGVFLSQALAPLQGFTAGSLRAPDPALGLLPKRGQDLAPSEVMVPYRVFPVWGSAVASRFPARAAFVSRPKSEHGGCAHRVSHPLDALLPPKPAGLVPSRSRVWGSPFEALLRDERRAGLSTRQDPPEVS